MQVRLLGPVDVLIGETVRPVRGARRKAVLAVLGLRAGEQLLPELSRLTDEYPYDEQFCGLLMLALYRTGRQTDALARYQALRRRLAEELGIDPGPALRDIETRILQQDDSLAARPAAGTGTAAVPVPAQLPPGVRGFAGRNRELARLDSVARDAQALVISAVSGTAGVGKTALAVHWAHRVAARFPDGQLYVNLRGFDPSGSAMEPADAIQAFLNAFGVPAEQFPARLDAQAALYRSVLAGKRVLVVLDNARDVEQVRPLLPGTPGCLVVVTSRNELPALVASQGAHPLSLDLLDPDGARELLTRRIGVERVAAEPDAIGDIITACARLPLALAIVAARAALRPAFPLAALVAELGTLDADVRAVFSWSLRALTPTAARLFGLLGLHPGPDISALAAASLAAESPDRLRPLLTELTGAHLLTEHVPGRYTFHDLLRMYDHYLHSAIAAAREFAPQREHIWPAPPRPGVTPEHPADHDDALAWFNTEHRILLSLIGRAQPRWDGHVWQIAWALGPYMDRQGHWDENAAMLGAAMAAARRLNDRAAQAYLHRSLGVVYARLGELDKVRQHNQRAIELFAAVGDAVGEAHTWMGVAWLSHQKNDYARDTRRALELYRAVGHRVGEARALGNLSWFHAERGEYEQAIDCSRQALAVHQEAGDREGEATAWDSLGYTYQRSGDQWQAVDSYRHAADLRRMLGDRYAEAETLSRLGDTHRAGGDSAAARVVWLEALAVLEKLGHADAEGVRAKLVAL